MKFYQKAKYRLRQHSYEYKNIKAMSRSIVKKVGEIDKYLDEEINGGSGRRKRKK
ncbi:MAG: hypothetical protein GX308_08210 [Epulopiscium sp.]|nr:hypothetical protein [Candidatus Epulonipiscium sp.]